MPSIHCGRLAQGAAESTLARSIQYCKRRGFKPHVAWKWLAGAYCLYSPIVAYFGTIKVCGHDQFDVLRHGVGQLLGQIDRARPRPRPC